MTGHKPIHPRVVVSDISSGPPLIIGVPTEITAFVGEAARSPGNQAVQIQGFIDF